MPTDTQPKVILCFTLEEWLKHMQPWAPVGEVGPTLCRSCGRRFFAVSNPDDCPYCHVHVYVIGVRMIVVSWRTLNEFSREPYDLHFFSLN